MNVTMREIHLTDTVFKKAEEVAAANGYSDVDAFITDLIEVGSAESEGDYDLLFSPEVMTDIRKGMADLDAGNTSTLDEVEARFAKKREAWLRDRAS